MTIRWYGQTGSYIQRFIGSQKRVILGEMGLNFKRKATNVQKPVSSSASAILVGRRKIKFIDRL